MCANREALDPPGGNDAAAGPFEAVLSDLSLRFVSLPSSKLDSEIEGALGRLCELLDLDMAVLWQWTETAPPTITPTHTYFAQAPLAPAEPMREEQYPWARRQMVDGRTIVFSSPDELPPEASIDAAYCRHFGIRSNLTLPLTVGDEPAIGALSLNTTRVTRVWPDAVVKRLELVAHVFANALIRRRHELHLQESEERVRTAADSAEAGLWSLDYVTGVFWASAKARLILQCSQDELITLDRLHLLMHPDDRDRVRAAIDGAARSSDPVNGEFRVVLPPDGRVRWIAARARPHHYASGAPGRLMGALVDVTTRRRTQSALRASEARLAAGVDLAGLGFYEVDFERGTVYVDDRFRDLCGLPSDRQDGFQPLDFWMEQLHPEDRPRVLQARQQVLDGDLATISVEYRYLHPDQGEKWIQHIARVASRDASRRVIKSFGVLRDVTDRRRAEETLRQSYAEIKQLKDRLQAESDYLRAEVGEMLAQGEIIGQSAAITHVLRLAAQVSPADSSVLVCGETGTGKELIAQAIHRLSPRGRHAMVKVNCAALPSGLVESELFGREKGAFTGALTRQVGRFEVADGSTIFLDEIGDLPLDVQVKLLRVLQEGEFERLGSPKTIKVNVRVIAATNRDLLDEVRGGRFREDLYYRLNVFPIRVPPLRERAEDIPLLVWAFLDELSARMGKKITLVPRTVMDALQCHPWPGNVRELRNMIEHGVIMTTGDTLKMPMLREATVSAAAPATLAEVERAYIVKVLESTHWHIKGPRGAAAALGLNPATLYSRMKKLGVALAGHSEEGATHAVGTISHPRDVLSSRSSVRSFTAQSSKGPPVRSRSVS
jgi:formate hydrogenlyase transcriptional activator